MGEIKVNVEPLTTQKIMLKYIILLLMIIKIITLSKSLKLFRKPVTVTNFRSQSLSDMIDNDSTSEDSISKDELYMRLALRHAQHAFRDNEVPIGAVLVDSDGTILAGARNQVESRQDATAHAEMLCLRSAAKVKNNWRLHGCTLYSTLEPCVMCMGAAQGFRISRIVYGSSDNRLGACGSWLHLNEENHPFHSKIEVVGNVLASDSASMLKRFFKNRRIEQKSQNDETISRGCSD